MELIQIDSVKQSFIETRFYQYNQTLRWDDILLLDTERCLPIRKHREAREKRYSFGYAVFLILALMK